MEPPPPHSSSKSPSAESPLDAPLALLGFQFDEVTPRIVSGHLLVTEKCCQPLNMLHGGVSALIVESLASVGAHLASGLKRVAGFNLNIHHIKSAQLGDLVVAQATPTSVGRTVQVWKVLLWKTDSSNCNNKTLISSATMAVFCHLPVPESALGALAKFQKYAKL